MKNKKKTTDYGLGELAIPVMDILSTGLLKLFSLLVDLTHHLLSKYVFLDTPHSDFEKIERKSLGVKRTTLADNAIGYSVTAKRNLIGEELDKSKHTAIIGASGSGKTVLLDTLIYEDMKEGKPVVYLDPKGDRGTLLTFIHLCKLTGRDFYIFSEHWQGEGACSLNPVKEGTSTNIADRFFHAFTWSEEHYAQICHDALEFAVARLKENSISVTLDSIYDELLNISDPKQKKDDVFFKRDDIGGILTRLNKIRRSDFGKLLNDPNGLSFSEIRNSKKCVYIGLSVLGYAEIARSIGKVILGDISYCAYDIYKHISPDSNSLTSLGIYIDELSAVITDEFIEILNKCRGAKMELTFAFQSPSDIAKHDPELCIQVLENASNWFIFKQRLESGAKIFSEAIGTMESKKQTVRVQDGEVQDQGSQRMVEELISHPNILKNLNVGQCVLLRHFPSRIDLLNVKYIDPNVLLANTKFLKKEVKTTKIHISKPSKKIFLTSNKNTGGTIDY